ncbi:hypothetical protein XENTR_v10002117 [Xenopus tropicalis]|nr:hypothetical protein XENTR_v10002117 [Xenopus tropicalis]KAE8633850.1 hypothetical protein XENTR_v10002117 [Xenopus tropicalis]
MEQIGSGWGRQYKEGRSVSSACCVVMAAAICLYRKPHLKMPQNYAYILSWLSMPEG